MKSIGSIDCPSIQLSFPSVYTFVGLSVPSIFSVLLSVRPSVPVRVRPSVRSVRLFVRPSVRPSVRQSIRMPVCPFVRLSVTFTVRSSVRPPVSVHPFVRPSIRLSVRSPICLSLHRRSVHPSNPYAMDEGWMEG